MLKGKIQEMQRKLENVANKGNLFVVQASLRLIEAEFWLQEGDEVNANLRYREAKMWLEKSGIEKSEKDSLAKRFDEVEKEFKNGEKSVYFRYMDEHFGKALADYYPIISEPGQGDDPNAVRVYVNLEAVPQKDREKIINYKKFPA